MIFVVCVIFVVAVFVVVVSVVVVFVVVVFVVFVFFVIVFFVVVFVVIVFVVMVVEGVATNLNFTRNVICQLLGLRCRRHKVAAQPAALLHSNKFNRNISRFCETFQRYKIIFHKCFLLAQWVIVS